MSTNPLSFHLNIQQTTEREGNKRLRDKQLIRQILMRNAPRWAYWQKIWEETSIENNSFSVLPSSGYPIAHKQYERYPRISLPQPAVPSVSLFQALKRRKSTREFTGAPIGIEKLSILLKYSIGLTEEEVISGVPRHYYPSAGARYPLEGYWVSLREDIPRGAYYYDPMAHELVVLLPTLSLDLRDLLPKAILGIEEFLDTASGFYVITAIPWRTMAKYGVRGVRHILSEAGHVAQNVYLIGAALGLGVCELGGYSDKRISEILDIDTRVEIPIGALAIGKEYSDTVEKPFP